MRKTEGMKNGATLSECGAYRYHLWRVWEECAPILCFVMLNPSTADAELDDPTIRRCIGFAKRDHYGGISVRNVFALRATDPKELLKHPDPIGPKNTDHLVACRHVSLLTRLVAAWGVPRKEKRLQNAYAKAKVICQINKAYCLGETKDGHPRHPLYICGDRELIRWKGLNSK